VAPNEELWIPLVDEPIGSILADLQAQDPEIERLVPGPRRMLAFKTFSYVRVGILLGELLVDTDVATDGDSSWVEKLLREPSTHDRVRALMREIAEEIAADPSYNDDDDVAPGDDVRERFRAFAKKLRAE
jgi:hypothetical protein